eukprot:7653506-Pyramimonas_sp.AAC.1
MERCQEREGQGGAHHPTSLGTSGIHGPRSFRRGRPSQERRGGRVRDCPRARQRARSNGSLLPWTSTWLS